MILPLPFMPLVVARAFMPLDSRHCSRREPRGPEVEIFTGWAADGVGDILASPIGQDAKGAKEVSNMFRQGRARSVSRSRAHIGALAPGRGLDDQQQ
jgi:hypothetical protein